MTVMTVLGPRSDAGGRTESRVERALDVLRYETRPHTIPLHRHARWARIATRADYIETLTLLLGFYRPLDRWLATSLAPLRFELDVAGRARAPLIARDLAALDAAFVGVRFRPAPVRIREPYALGWLYGIEIAALGGRMISKRVRDQLGIGRDNGAAFFAGHGADTHEMWQKLATVITRRIRREDELTAACGGAIDFFEALIDWLSPTRLAAA